MGDAPVFRATKRRRLAKPSKTSTEDANPSSLTQALKETEQHDGSQSDYGEYSTVIRASRSSRPTRTGLNFSTASRRIEAERDEAALLEPKGEAKESINAMSGRFVGAGGQVIEVDRNMVDYVDSRIKPELPITAAQEGISTTNQPQAGLSEPSHIRGVRESHAGYQLSQVDLPTPSHAHAGQRQGTDTTGANRSVTRQPRRPRKPRLGRDGKPFRPRQRHRRASEDLARDALVEQVLHESKLDAVYMTESSDSEDEEGVADGDEAFAERFKQGFMDQVAERQAQQQQKIKPPEQTKEGPKLGGSRTARAKMQALQESAGPQKR